MQDVGVREDDIFDQWTIHGRDPRGKSRKKKSASWEGGKVQRMCGTVSKVQRMCGTVYIKSTENVWHCIYKKYRECVTLYI